VTALKAEIEELEATFNKEQLQGLQLKKELAEAEARNTQLTKASFTISYCFPVNTCVCKCVLSV